jgi:hypothetical protein
MKRNSFILELSDPAYVVTGKIETLITDQRLIQSKTSTDTEIPK